MLVKQQKRIRRHKRVRAKIKGTAKVPRLGVFRSNQHIYAQLVDDEEGKTLAAASDLELPHKAAPRLRGKKTKRKSITKADKAGEVGKLIAKKAIARKIKKVVFDRGGYKYHGRIKALAEGAREAGLKF